MPPARPWSYGPDRDHLARYAALAATAEGFRDYLERQVLAAEAVA
jgi:hypothetical protein